MKKWIKDLKVNHFVGGQWVEGESDEVIKVENKYSGELLAEVRLFGAGQKEQLIEASQSGFAKISKWSQEQRATSLKLCSKFIENNFKLFTECIVAEAGKPIHYAKAEVNRAIFNLNWCAEEAKRLNGEVVPINFLGTKEKFSFTKRFPIGPILGISPFNFPLNLSLHKIGPAIAAGCSITLKPSPFAPLTALLLGEMAQYADLPDGALNVVVSDVETSESLVIDDSFKVLSFTGSPKVGWHLKSICGKKKALLELGGNAPLIIDRGIDVDAYTDSIINGLFLYSGQICISTQRIYLVEDVYEQMLQALLVKMRDISVGDPNNEDTLVGPLINRDALNRIEQWVSEAVEEGATILGGGHVIDKNKNLYGPTLLTNVKDDMKVNCEEVFGPIGIIKKVSSFEQAVSLANNTQFGLQVGVITQNIDKMKFAMENLEFGGVIMNSIPGFRVDNMPYGGIKNSGLGREGAKYAIDEFTEPRLFVI
ncbi:MAG: aldehyde dehydrogenase family protein [Bacteriovoracaceae bacterium]